MPGAIDSARVGGAIIRYQQQVLAMRESDRAFFSRRLREEMQLAGVVQSKELKELHLRWAQFFEARLNGDGTVAPPPLASQLS